MARLHVFSVELLELSTLKSRVFCSGCRNYCLEGGTEHRQIEFGRKASICPQLVAGLGQHALGQRG